MRAQKNRSKTIKRSTIDRVILFLGYSVLALFTIAIVIPLAYVVIASFMDPNVLNNQGISFRMSDWSLEAYRRGGGLQIRFFTPLQQRQSLFSLHFLQLIQCLKKIW